MTTNVEFMTDMMEHSNYGALKQAFVISALDVYSRMCVRDLEECNVAGGFIAPETWQAIAKEVQNDLLKKYRKDAA